MFRLSNQEYIQYRNSSKQDDIKRTYETTSIYSSLWLSRFYELIAVYKRESKARIIKTAAEIGLGHSYETMFHREVTQDQIKSQLI